MELDTFNPTFLIHQIEGQASRYGDKGTGLAWQYFIQGTRIGALPGAFLNIKDHLLAGRIRMNQGNWTAGKGMRNGWGMVGHFGRYSHLLSE
jgi:hypothetical protein